jgi:hypothetical protein
MANLTISPTIVKALQVIKLNVPVTPTEINDHVGDGDYASKHVWYLGKLGFTVTKQKDGRKVSSYTLIAEPENAEAIRNTIHGAARKAAAPKAPKAPKATKAPKVVAPKKAATKTAAPKKVAAKKSVAEIKAANLAKLKAVGAKFKADRPMTDADILRDEPKATTFSLDGDWDSIDGLDLSKLI